MTHICVRKLTIIGSNNGLSSGRRQAIIWTNARILIGTLGTNFGEILIEIRIFSFKKMSLNVSSAKWRPFYIGLNVIKQRKWETCNVEAKVLVPSAPFLCLIFDVISCLPCIRFFVCISFPKNSLLTKIYQVGKKRFTRCRHLVTMNIKYVWENGNVSPVRIIAIQPNVWQQTNGNPSKTSGDILCRLTSQGYISFHNGVLNICTIAYVFYCKQ